MQHTCHSLLTLILDLVLRFTFINLFILHIWGNCQVLETQRWLSHGPYLCGGQVVQEREFMMECGPCGKRVKGGVLWEFAGSQRRRQARRQ